MAEMINLQVEKREKTGKEFNRKLRKQGYIPAVYYDFEGKNVLLQVKTGSFLKVWHQAGTTNVIELEVRNGEEPQKYQALIWDVEKHPVKEQIVHIDFYGPNLREEVEMLIPIKIIGKAKGVEKGGVLEVFREELEVKCLPLNIPEHIEIDVTDLDINQNLHIDEIPFPEGIRPIFEENFAVVGVVEPEKEEEETEEETEEEA
ncbi:MAG: 50S ribosomal protein L25 [Desulfonauticus sp.]|nr:50S ribosomal protein L25 [Desulfonauticus sp.]